jgi:DNA-binding HxlR family transcriptional regulator
MTQVEHLPDEAFEVEDRKLERSSRKKVPEQDLQEELQEWVALQKLVGRLSTCDKLLSVRPHQSRILNTLCEKEQRFTHLKRQLGVHQQTLTPILTELRELGLVRKVEGRFGPYCPTFVTPIAVEWARTTSHARQWRKKRVTKQLKQLHRVHRTTWRLLPLVEDSLENHATLGSQLYLLEFLVVLTRYLAGARSVRHLRKILRVARAHLDLQIAELAQPQRAELLRIAGEFTKKLTKAGENQ